MLRATREFIKSRQPYTDFQVCTQLVRPDPQPLRLREIQDAVATRVRTHPDWRAVIGWRVSAYDPNSDETLFQPWWWIIDHEGQAWDIDPHAQALEYIQDQALVVYRAQQFQQNQPIRPPDLYLHQGAWEFRVPGERHTLPRLDRENLTSRDRCNIINVTQLGI